MIIDCISDLHGHLPELPGGDLLIVAGDLTRGDYEIQHKGFGMWLEGQRYEKKVFIAGNHDNYLTDKCVTGYACNLEYLCDSGTEFQGLKIWGSPWTKTFEGMNPACKAFTVDSELELAKKWLKIPLDTAILITHSPPHCILDLTKENKFAGSSYLRNWLLDSNVKLHVFGHIHECGGRRMILKRPGFGVENNIMCVNASVVNERYELVNEPVRIDLDGMDKH